MSETALQVITRPEAPALQPTHEAPQLVKPNFMIKASYINALREGHVCGNESVRSTAEISAIEADFGKYIEKLNRQDETVTWPNGDKGPEVPYERLWLTDGEHFMGETMVRYKLNDYYEQHRGHISYGVPPAYRGQGLATLILKEDLKRLADAGVKQALLTCSITNGASIKVIRKNGGKLKDMCRFPWKPTPLTCRFTIDL